MFDGDEYYIYDYYVLNIIPYYLEYYETNFLEKYKSLEIDESHINDKKYIYFYDILSKIKDLRGFEFCDVISKHKLD